MLSNRPGATAIIPGSTPTSICVGSTRRALPNDESTSQVFASRFFLRPLRRGHRGHAPGTEAHPGSGSEGIVFDREPATFCPPDRRFRQCLPACRLGGPTEVL